MTGASLQRWRTSASGGGVLEHPEGSRAFGKAPGFSIGRPKRGGWSQPDPMWRPREWLCSVDQGRYGHMARKRTWLLYVGDEPPPPLDWRDGATGVWVASGPGGKTAAERAAKGITLMVDSSAGKDAKELTPPAFVDALLNVARRSVENQSHRQRELTPPLC